MLWRSELQRDVSEPHGTLGLSRHLAPGAGPGIMPDVKAALWEAEGTMTENNYALFIIKSASRRA